MLLLTCLENAFELANRKVGIGELGLKPRFLIHIHSKNYLIRLNCPLKHEAILDSFWSLDRDLIVIVVVTMQSILLV